VVRIFPFNKYFAFSSAFVKSVGRMSSRIDVDYLTQEELTYELKVRGVMETGTVREMKATLRKLLALEKEGQVLLFSPMKLNETEELDTVANKLHELNQLITQTPADQISSITRKLNAMLTHLINRVSRVEPSQEILIQRKSKLLHQLINFWVPAEESGEAGVPPDDVLEAEGISDSNDQPHQDTPRLHRRRLASPTQDRRVFRTQMPVRDWGLSFSGDKDGPSVLSFLEDIDHYRQARNASFQDLYNGAIDLFKGSALVWFKSIRRRVQSWHEIEIHLKEEYLEEGYEDNLLREILGRAQGPDERFGTFVAIMESLFSRLPTPMTESRRVSIIINNSLPYFYGWLRQRQPQTMDDLLKEGRRIQHDKEHVERYKPPPPPRQTQYGSDSGYSGNRRGHRSNETQVCSSSHSPTPRNSSAASSAHSPSPNPSTAESSGNTQSKRREWKCWHCAEKGHGFRACPKLRLEFCTRCGSRELSNGNCRACSRSKHSGNSRGGRR